MKKVAVLIYDKFCIFEISVALQILAIAQKPISVFAKTLNPIRSEEGVLTVADKTLDELNIDEFDSLLLTGSTDIREAVEDNDILAFIKKFDRNDIIIGAISIAPVLLLKTGILHRKRFMIGANKINLIEEGFTMNEMELMIDWDEGLNNPYPEGYIRDGNIITSVSYGYAKWAVAYGHALGLDVNPKSFGLY